MGIDKETGYYSLREILGYNAKWNFVLSDRGRGKTWGTKWFLINQKCAFMCLYRNTGDQTYYLLLGMADHTAEDFNKFCNIASEYGRSAPAGKASLLYYKEHFTPVADADILGTLAKLN